MVTNRFMIRLDALLEIYVTRLLSFLYSFHCLTKLNNSFRLFLSLIHVNMANFPANPNINTGIFISVLLNFFFHKSRTIMCIFKQKSSIFDNLNMINIIYGLKTSIYYMYEMIYYSETIT